MTFKKFVRAFVAGMAFPAVFLPVAYTVLYLLKFHNMHMHVLQFVPMYIPLVFGFVNVLYVHLSENATNRNANVNLWLTGGFLGLLVALFGVFVLHLPTVVFGFTSPLNLMPIFVLPILYGAIFRFIVKWLNKALSV